MRIRLGRRAPVRLGPFTGSTFCGCRWFYGDRVWECPEHAAPAGGRHRPLGDSGE